MLKLYFQSSYFSGAPHLYMLPYWTEQLQNIFIITRSFIEEEIAESRLFKMQVTEIKLKVYFEKNVLENAIVDY